MVKKKLKPLLPSLREKKRYLAFEVISREPIQDYLPVYDAIHNSVLELMGELQTAKSGVIMLKEKWEPKKQKGIIRVNHRYVEHLRASLAHVDKIGHEEVIVQSLGISGILKKATNKYIAC